MTFRTKKRGFLSSKSKGKGKEIEEIVFDEAARRYPVPTTGRLRLLTPIRKCREYLTGFHRRNVRKKEEEKAAAKERDKRRRREARAEVNFIYSVSNNPSPSSFVQKRQALAEKALENARQVEEAYGGCEFILLISLQLWA